MEEGSKIVKFLKSNLDCSNIVLGPSSSNMLKVNNIYNIQVVIKYKRTDFLIDKLSFINSKYI